MKFLMLSAITSVIILALVMPLPFNFMFAIIALDLVRTMKGKPLVKAGPITKFLYGENL